MEIVLQNADEILRMSRNITEKILPKMQFSLIELGE